MEKQGGAWERAWLKQGFEMGPRSGGGYGQTGRFYAGGGKTFTLQQRAIEVNYSGKATFTGAREFRGAPGRPPRLKGGGLGIAESAYNLYQWIANYPVDIAELGPRGITGIETGKDWARAAGTFQYTVPSGWSRCAAPDWLTCAPFTEPAPALWDWHTVSPPNPGVCTTGPMGPCPKLQASAYDNVINDKTGFPASVSSVVFSRRSPSNNLRFDLIRRYVGPSTVGNTSLPRYEGRVTVPMPAEKPEPSQRRERRYGAVPHENTLKRLKPYEVPGVEVQVRPGRPGKPPVRRVHPIIHRRLPPGKRGPKDKWVLGDGLAGKFYGQLTEIGDLLDCLERSIKQPRNVKHAPIGRRLGTQLQYVAMHASQIDMVAAAKCLAANEFSDRAIGRANRFVKMGIAHAAEQGYHRWAVGVGRGGFSHRMVTKHLPHVWRNY